MNVLLNNGIWIWHRPPHQDWNCALYSLPKACGLFNLVQNLYVQGTWDKALIVYPHNLSRLESLTKCRSIPVSTILWKSVRFFTMNIFLVKKLYTFQVKIWKMVWTVSKYPVWMSPKSWKRDFGELKSKKFPRGACPQTSLEVGNPSVFILDPRLLTVCKCYCKGSNFSSFGLGPWRLVWAGLNRRPAPAWQTGTY